MWTCKDSITFGERAPARATRATTPVVVAVLLVVGVVATAVTGSLIYDARQAAADVEPVEWTVLRTEVEEHVGTTGRDRPVVEYEYTYGGETYTNDNVFPGPGDQPDATLGTSGPSAGGVVERYEAGERVTVHVDPNDPSESCLLARGPAEGLYAMVAFFGLFSLLAAVGLGRRLRG